MANNKIIREKFRESAQAVLPLMVILLLLSFTIAPMPSAIMLAFLIGGLFLIVGMMFFNIGADMAMAPMGMHMGAAATESRKLWVILPVGFVLGFMITLSEPDLKVLADQFYSIPSSVMMVGVSVAVGIFLLTGLLRMFCSVPLNAVLIVSYALILILAFIVPDDFLPVAFDAGGVTIGPMTAPFIIAFGMGVSSMRNDRSASEDSFGLLALTTAGPVLMVLLLSLIYPSESSFYQLPEIPAIEDSVDLGRLFTSAMPCYAVEIAVALLPIVAFFFLFRIFVLKIEHKSVIRIAVGIGYTYLGLLLFLVGVNVGFLPAGSFLGGVLATLPGRVFIVPLGAVIGYFIVKAEPAVYVLQKQVEELTDGAIEGKTLNHALSISVAISVACAMVRVLTGLSLIWFVVPGYLLAIVLSLFVPRLYTAIAFDSGSVASGPMSATFLLPFTEGISIALGGCVVTDAFGVVAMVTMTPPITIQVLGLMAERKKKRAKRESMAAGRIFSVPADTIIEL